MNETLSQVRRLGTGEREDRLSLGLLVAIFRRTFPFLATVKRHLALFVLLFLLVFGLSAPFFLAGMDAMWNGVLAGQPIAAQTATLLGFDPALYADVDAIAASERRALRTRIMWWTLGVGTLLGIGGALAWYYFVWILQRINQALRLGLMSRMRSLSLRFHNDAKVGDGLYRVYQDSAVVTAVIRSFMLRPAWCALRYSVGLVVVSLMDPRLGLMMLCALPLALVCGWFLSAPMRRAFRRSREATSDLTSGLQEVLAGIRVIKAYGAEDAQRERFEERSREAFRRAFDARFLRAGFSVLGFWSAGIVWIAAATFAAVLTLNAEGLFAAQLLGVFGFTAWSVGLFNSFTSAGGMGISGYDDTFRNWSQIQDIAIGLDRVFERLDQEPEVQDVESAVELEAIERDVAFDGVSFAYGPGRPVLDDVRFEAPVGTITAIVGPTGAGKSTLVSLLLRLYDPDTGAIRIDGRDLREFKVASLRRQIAMALQENVLFGMTIRENIRYAVPDASDAAVRMAAKVACADGFIEEHPDGYDTMLGERGAKLSTGQRQRISIARALLLDAPILILDEPTAALDAETELAVMKNLTAWGEGRAIFLVTHRLSTIRRADRIVFLREGRVLEVGSHDELMALPGGHYRKLVEAETEGLARAAS